MPKRGEGVTKKEIVEILNDFAGDKRYCRVELKTGEVCFGEPVSVSDGFLIMALEDDFLYDGFVIAPITKIAEVKEGYYFIRHILESENICPDFKQAEGVDITSFKSIFKSLLNENLIVCCDNSESLHIGKAVNICDDCVEFLRFDAEGVWDSESIKIDYKDIVKIHFGSRYVKYYSKYLI